MKLQILAQRDPGAGDGGGGKFSESDLNGLATGTILSKDKQPENTNNGSQQQNNGAQQNGNENASGQHNGSQQQQNQGNQGQNGAQQNGNQQQNGAAGQQNQPPAFDHNKWLGGLGFKTPEEAAENIINYRKQLERVPTLEKELNEAKAAPKFKSERSKLIYDLANSHEGSGQEREAMKRYLEIADMDLTKTPEHLIRYRAFELDPRNKGLSQDDLQALFADEELKNFGNPNPADGQEAQSQIQKIRQKQATQEASAKLEKIKTDYENARPVEQDPKKVIEEQQRYQTHVQEKLKTFDGLNLALSATGADGKKVEGKVAYKIDAQKQMPEVIKAVVDPQGWWDDTLSRLGIVADGKEPDLNKWAELVTKILYFDEIANANYNQGHQDQLAGKLTDRRNAGGLNNDGSQGAGDGSQVQKSKTEELVESVSKLVGIN